MQNNQISAEIITVGTEITTGNTLNTNANYLSKELFDLGIESYYQTTVDDNEFRLSSVIRTAICRANLIIITGGLGPTKDDITKEVLAKVLGLALVHDDTMENQIRDYFKANNRPMSDNNLRQAKRLENSKFLDNSLGTAPGIYIEKDGSKFFLLPGPPRELVMMFKKQVKPLLNMGGITISRSINTIGIGESTLETKLLEMNLATANTSVTTFAKENSLEIRVISKGTNKSDLEKEFNHVISKINLKFKEYIYGYDNISLEETVIRLLKEKNLSLGLSESCTGGLISSKLTSVPGASQVFDRGLVTYSNNAKLEELKVNIETLNKFGAVSKETAYEMANGLFKKTKNDISVSITGIAGPDGGTEDKPIGLVYICIMDKNSHINMKVNFNGDRKTIQNKSSLVALNEIRKFVLSNY